MNSSLEVVFTKEKVLIALTQMHPNKSPGPDGMAPMFFLSFWNIIGQEVTDAVGGITYSKHLGFRLPS